MMCFVRHPERRLVVVIYYVLQVKSVYFASLLSRLSHGPRQLSFCVATLSLPPSHSHSLSRFEVPLVIVCSKQRRPLHPDTSSWLKLLHVLKFLHITHTHTYAHAQRRSSINLGRAGDSQPRLRPAPAWGSPLDPPGSAEAQAREEVRGAGRVPEAALEVPAEVPPRAGRTEVSAAVADAMAATAAVAVDRIRTRDNPIVGREDSVASSVAVAASTSVAVAAAVVATSSSPAAAVRPAVAPPQHPRPPRRRTVEDSGHDRSADAAGDAEAEGAAAWRGGDRQERAQTPRLPPPPLLRLLLLLFFLAAGWLCRAPRRVS